MEENNMNINLEFATASVKKGDVIGSTLYQNRWYDAVWIGDNGSNFKLVERDEKPIIQQ